MISNGHSSGIQQPRPRGALPGPTETPPAAPPGLRETLKSRDFVADTTAFLCGELTAHVDAVESIRPPQSAILGVATSGQFSWGSFMRALADVSMLAKTRVVGGQAIPALVGQLGLIEAELGGQTFAQLGAALALKKYGVDLDHNAVWQTLAPSERDAWRALLDPERFYNRRQKKVIKLPDSYLGVAARLVSIDVQMGLEVDLEFATALLERASAQYFRGVLYSDDQHPTGRYDRYSQEYARFVYDAALNLNSSVVREAMEAALRAVMRTWWDLVSADGYSYAWGRTIGLISYMDSLEIVGFLAAHREFRPVGLPELAGVYVQALRSLLRDYSAERHLLDMFGFGRGNYGYMSSDRQWQQTTSFLGKAADSLARLSAALQNERVEEFPAKPRLPSVARFEWFRQAQRDGNAAELGGRPSGVWLVRQPPLAFAMPFTTGLHAAVADYLPAPHGLEGFAAPVEQSLPALVPYLELNDGQIVAASDGADDIEPAADGRSVTARWVRHAVVGAKPGQLLDVGITSDVAWSIHSGALVRHETLSTRRALRINRLWIVLPSTATVVSTHFEGERRIDRLAGGQEDGFLEIEASSPHFRFNTTIEATSNTALGRGARLPIPLLWHAHATDLTVTPDAPIEFVIRLRVSGASGGPR